ncbi:MAG: hypothetical protein ACLQFR_32235 [Streptosporangiaceae bacterium]
MTEQAGRPHQQENDQPARARDGSDRVGSGRAGSGRADSGRPGSGRGGSGAPGANILNEFQRWLIRSSARNMRKEIGGQVRKTFSGSRTQSADVWDVATTEIPLEVGEAPECQWCPICRAARQLRESGPGIGGHISGAGNAVASAVQDAINAFDSVLSKAAGTSDRDREDRDRWDRERQERVRQEQTGPHRESGSQPSPGAAAASRPAERAAAPIAVTPAPIAVPGADSPETVNAAVRRAVRPESGGAGTGAGTAEPNESAETALLGSPASQPDAWSLVTDRADGSADDPGADVAPRGQAEDGRHGPDDRR